MISSKRLTILVSVLMVLVVGLCLFAVVFQDRLEPFFVKQGTPMEYQEKLFDTDKTLSVNILMEETEWDTMLKNATAEEYVACDVEINGEVFRNVGIRPKGNTSLSSVASDPDTNRFSFKLEFDQFDNTQNCYGLDKLVLNNNYADNTNMKEALIYDMFAYLGADAPLYNFAEILVNGEYWGTYLALESVEESFLLRNYGNAGGALYKPDGMNMGGKKEKGDQGGDRMPPGGMPKFDRENMPEPDPENMQDFQGGNRAKGGMPGGFGGRGSQGGANLNYIDDALDSYATIWDGEITDASENDHKRVVTALKNIHNRTDIETYLDVDNLLKYMAVHIFSVNQDSLSGMMAHNYYIYEEEGRLNIIPWDYNLSFGGMGRESDATATINDAIDTPFSMTEFFDPLLENETYRNQYHGYLEKLVKEYIAGGRLDVFYQAIRNRIDELVKTDPNSFVSYEEYAAAAEMLMDVVKLRGQSILGQLSGEIPSTDQGQKENPEKLLDASHLDLTLLGSMHGGDRMREFINQDKEN